MSEAVPEEGFEELYEDGPFGYLSMRPDGRVVKANAILAKWTGYTPAQLLEKRFLDLLTVGTRIVYETSFAPLLNLHGFCDELSLDLRTEQGEVLAVFGSAKTCKQTNGRPSIIRVAFFKASERRRYERQLVLAHEQIKELERTTQDLLRLERQTAELREQFIAVLGHDLRNPLASFAGGLRLIKKDPPPEKRKYLLDLLEGSVVRMGALIDNVLDFARGRLGSGIPIVERVDIPLTPVLEHVVAELRIGMPDRAVETEFDLPRPVKCDPSRIAQLVSNLLGNALTHGTPDKPVRVHGDEKDGNLTIWVANSGVPIPADAMASLFQPFFRGDAKSSQQGLGLGLYIASEIAKAHGGKLTVASSPEETRFTFCMSIRNA